MRGMPAQAIVVAFVVSLLAVLLLLRFGRGLALDRPNERSLHERPVPRTGGIGLLLGVLAVFLSGDLELWLPVLLAVILAALSFADDVYGLPTLVRLGAHFAAAAVALWYWLTPIAPWALALLILAVVWITNLYNFMDGSDGLAGGMAVIGFGAYALAAPPGALALLCSAIAAASGAFLVFNFPPARVFMGDAGSIPLGFLAGALGLLGWRDDLWPLWFPLLAFAPFVADATFTLLRRLIRRERIWRAHKEHYYQRLVRMGFGHRGTALIGYAAMAVCAGVALFSREKDFSIQIWSFAAASLCLAILAAWVDWRWKRWAGAA